MRIIRKYVCLWVTISFLCYAMVAYSNKYLQRFLANFDVITLFAIQGSEITLPMC